MMKKFCSLLVLLFPPVSSSRSSEGAVGSQLPETTLISEPLTRRLADLKISKPVTWDPKTFYQTCSLAKDYNLKKLNEILRLLIDVDRLSVNEASLVLLSSPIFHNLTEDVIDNAVWNGYHYFLRCLQRKNLRVLPLIVCSKGLNSSTQVNNVFKNLDQKVLHKLLAYAYKRSWCNPSFWNDHVYQTDWAEFWEIIIEVDNVQLFEDLFTQGLPLPFNRLSNLEKSKLSDLVKKYKANKIGAYLWIPGCDKAIIFNGDGRLDFNLLEWDKFKIPLFTMDTFISMAIKLDNLDLLKKFKLTYPKHFPFLKIANEALRQAQFNTFYWVYSEYPVKKLKNINLYLGTVGSDHLEERLEFLCWIFEKFPQWVPHRGTINKLQLEIFNRVLEFNPNIHIMQEYFSGYPGLGLLKWALRNKPEWIQINAHTLSIVEKYHDLDLFKFIYEKYQGADVFLQDIDLLAFEMGCMDSIASYMARCRIPKQEYILAAAKKGHIKVLESLGHKIDFTKRSTFIEVANSGHINVVEHIHQRYPWIFKGPLDIDEILCHYDKDDDRKLNTLKYLYELFTFQKIRLSLKGLVGLMRHENLSVFDWILEKHPTVFEDEIKKSTERAYWNIKLMILYAVEGRQREKVEFLMGQFRGKLYWTLCDLCSIAKSKAFYLLDILYSDYGKDKSLWNPRYFYPEEPAFIQWYHHKVQADLPWDNLAFSVACSPHFNSLYWILSKSPNVNLREEAKQRLLAEEPNLSHPLEWGVTHALLTKGDNAVYYIPANAYSIEDEVVLHYNLYELQSHQPMETTTLEVTAESS